jgi:hypothetical protein
MLIVSLVTLHVIPTSPQVIPFFPCPEMRSPRIVSDALAVPAVPAWAKMPIPAPHPELAGVVLSTWRLVRLTAAVVVSAEAW